jgi:hypothetical protein
MYLTPAQFNQRMHYIKAKSRAVSVLFNGVIGPKQLAKYFFVLVFGNAAAMVPNFQSQILPAFIISH